MTKKEIEDRMLALESEMSELEDDLRWLNKEWDELSELLYVTKIKNQG